MDKFIQAEFALLKALAHKPNFDAYYESLDEKLLTDDTKLLLHNYKKYYELYGSDDIDFNAFYSHFSQNWNSDLDADDMEYYKQQVIPNIVSIRDSQIGNSLLMLEEKQCVDKMRKSLHNGVDVSKLRDYIDTYERKYQDIVVNTDTDAYTIDRVDFSVLDKASGIPWMLPTLQRALGSLVQGQFVVVSADYGTGKSAFVINQAVKAFVKCQDRPILYFNSEGTQADVFTRFLSCLYHKHINGGFEEVLERIDEVKEKFQDKFNYQNFMVFQITVGDFALVKQKVEQYKPALIIIDIADVLSKEEDVRSLKKLYDSMRLLSGVYCPIIATTQSGDTSYQDKNSGEIKTRKFLGGKALYGSKAGKGGAADTIITIGKDDSIPDIRYINVPKKKRGEQVKFTCEIVDKFSMYKEN